MQNNIEDIDLARSLLQEDKRSLVIVKKGQVIFGSRERGIAPFYQAVQRVGKGLHNASVADRIVGLAVAMLCLHAQVRAVYADIVSRGALAMLNENGIDVDSRDTVAHITNYDGTDLCPFEKLAESCQKPSQLLAALKSLFGEGDQ
jgi:hypothetical protein